MTRLDLPPVWLAIFIAAAWGLSLIAPGFAVDIPWQGMVALGLLILGLVLTGLAVFEMTRARTTVIPKRQPTALVTSGVFRLSRNPIYLADVLFLTAAVLWTGMALAFFLVPAFIWLIRRRFIDGEEAGLQAAFGKEFENWRSVTRRWI